MPLTEDERVDIKSSIVIMEHTMTAMSRAQTDNARALTKVADGLVSLTTTISSQQVENKHLKQEITQIQQNQTDAMELFAPVINRARKSQEKWDSFTSGMTSNWGRLVSVAIIVAVAMALGVDISKLFKL